MKKTRINNPKNYFQQSTLEILLLLLVFMLINHFENSIFSNILPFLFILFLFIFNLHLYKKYNYIKYDDNKIIISRFYFEKTEKFTFHFFNNVKVKKIIKKNEIKKEDIKEIDLEEEPMEINSKIFKVKEISIKTNNDDIRFNILNYKKKSLKEIFGSFKMNNEFKRYLEME